MNDFGLGICVQTLIQNYAISDSVFHSVVWYLQQIWEKLRREQQVRIDLQLRREHKVQNEGTTTEGKKTCQSHMSGPIQSQNMMYCLFLWHFDICLFSIQLGHAKTCVGSQCSSSAKWALPSEMLCKRFFEGPAREIGCGGCGHLSHPHDKFPNPWTKQLVLFGFWGFPWCVCPTFFPGFYGQVSFNRTLPYGI